jgi:hypothetical protein
MMHDIINKTYMEKFKPLIKEGNVHIIVNVSHTISHTNNIELLANGK